MPGQAQLIGRWDDFGGGHWGAAGGGASMPKASWGGKNVAVTRAGTLSPVAASRPLVFENMAAARIALPPFWPWGVDGRVYFLQAEDEEAGEWQVRSFVPKFDGSAITVDDVGDPLTVDITRQLAWTSFSDKVYLSIYGDATYEIDPSGPSITALTGAPGGRAITSLGEHLLIGGLDDGSFGTVGNRVVFNEAGDLNDWPALNFFDIGTDLTEIAGLYQLRGGTLVIIFSDQTMHVFRGVPGSGSQSQQRVYGFHAGSGGITTFVGTNAVVDPAQALLWLFDHTQRAPARFNGAQVARVTNFGMLTAERTSELNPDGVVVAHGGPDDVVFDRVPVPRGIGEGAVGESNMLLRVNGAFALLDQRIVKGRA